ncbi:conserved hypothetical protein [Trichormus variabilis ATCC 29413]|uniref:SPOR domain-containing protein n=3 Tax=Anabaena variabilis TaxID=264691 RepID=Q3M5R8_TRIV2|nr:MULTISPECIES: hypothetical protein [Nostocaceae]MBC1313449.1 hypothetical protein [Trichormus variabilis PNB]ABA23668.1 conserved hypothetical protein [Trichormus variabilis ATCC 29413]MBC1216455.1 hypothetical protein [Trichormus variabilis ARAD]MBC1256463.1 hypothetical protein [Trichormus variabilis V5]MBC1266112.1 hypothetical protein [Trichormus variabilis FSR]
MSIQITSKYITLPIMPLLLGSWLTLVPSPAKGQIKNNDRVLLTQSGVFESLPPPPNVPTQEQEVEFNQYQQDYQPYQPVQYQYQSGQNFQRYFVYVDNNSYDTLQRVRRIEPSAYIRQYNGRSVIQSGVFNRESNAQQRVRELESSGIYGARIAGSGDGQGIPNSPGGGNYGSERSRYYVTIPAKPEEVPSIANRIRLAVGRNSFVRERRQPLGPHVAVGPFVQRTEAEQWSNYLRNMGFANARVYYGK